APTGGTVVNRCDAEADDPTCQAWGLDDGVTYYVSANAITALGEGPASARVPVTVGDPVTVPDVPRGLKVTAGARRADLTWTAPASDGGAPISRYTARAYRVP